MYAQGVERGEVGGQTPVSKGAGLGAEEDPGSEGTTEVSGLCAPRDRASQSRSGRDTAQSGITHVALFTGRG